VEGSGDELELEDNGRPYGEKDERGEPNHANGRIEDEEDLGSKESNTPEEHGLGQTEKECQILETIYVVPASGDVGVPITGRTLGERLMLRIQYDAPHGTDETAEQAKGRKEGQPDTGCKQNEVH